jgi:hypothetical protein
MTDVTTINDQELEILCDLMDGWGTNWGRNLDADKRQVLDQLIAKGFVEPADQQSTATFKHTLKASLLLAELCVGISGTLLR